MFEKLLKVQSGPLEFDFGEITAQRDRVAIMVWGHMSLKAGGSYDNVHRRLLILRDGRIAVDRGFCDALAVSAGFGAPEARKVA